MEGLKAGDRVRLKSGGPWMTVVQTNHVKCEFFPSNDADPYEEWFPAEALDVEKSEAEE